MRRRISQLSALLVIIAASARGEGLVNPSLAITREDAATQLMVDARSPKQLERPLVILGGFLDVGIGPLLYERRLRPLVRGPMLSVTFFDCLSFEACRLRVVRAVDERFGSVSDTETVEVDVVGQSMGGLVGLYASLERPSLGKRLKVRRLFTLSSPLQGARRAARMPLDLIPLVHDMRPGSLFCTQIAKSPIDCTVYSYTILNDRVVGEAYASLPGRGVWWVEAAAGEPTHPAISWDPRVLLDVTRRLRGENPVAMDPPAPLPTTRPARRQAR